MSNATSPATPVPLHGAEAASPQPGAMRGSRPASYSHWFDIALPLAEEAVARGEYPTVDPDQMARQVAHAAAGDMVRRGFTRMVRMPEVVQQLGKAA